MRDLFIISIIAPFIQEPIKRWPGAFLVVSIASWFLPINPWFRQTVPLFLIGGVFTARPSWNKLIKAMDYRIGILTLIGGIVSSFFNEKDFFYQLTIALYLMSAFIICNTVATRVAAQGVCRSIIPYTFMVYVLHGKPLSIFQIGFTTVFSSKLFIVIGYFIIPIACFVLCLAIAVIFKQLMPKTYKVCTGEW